MARDGAKERREDWMSTANSAQSTAMSVDEGRALRPKHRDRDG
jgi:hypothetical protein